MSRIVRNATALVVLFVFALFGLQTPIAGAASKSKVTILSYGDYTGLTPIPDPGVEDMVKEYVSEVNAAGGINGHPINLIVCDTKEQAAQASACVANAKREGVVAAIPITEIIDNVTNPLLDKQGIPILGANPSTPQAQFSTTSACFLNGPWQIYPSLFYYVGKLEHVKSMGFIGVSGEAGEQYQLESVKIAAKAVHMKVPTTITPPTTDTDFPAQVAELTSDGENGIMTNGFGPGFGAFVRAVTSTHPGVKLAGPGFTVFEQTVNELDTVLSQVNGKGLVTSSYNVLPTDTSIPFVRTFQTLIKKVYPADLTEERAFYDFIDLYGGIGLLKQVPKNEPIDAKTILSTMKTATINFHGAIPNWHGGHYNALGLGCETTNYTYLAQFNGTSFVPLQHDKPVTALTPAVIKYFKKALTVYAHVNR